MPASREDIILARIFQKPAEAYDILDRIVKVRPKHVGARLVLSCARDLAEEGLTPEPALVEKIILELDKGDKKSAIQSLTRSVALSIPTRDEVEFAVRSMLNDEKLRALREAVKDLGSEVDDEEIENAEQTLTDVIASLSELDYDNAMRAVDTDTYNFYQQQQHLGPRIGYGLRKMDRVLKGGGRRKDFHLIAGYSKEGKSTLCFQASCLNKRKGRNGVIISLEMTEDEVFCSCISNHTRKFWKGGIPYDDVENRGKRLGPKSSEALKRTIDDWQTNKKYGKLSIIVPKDDATILTCGQLLLQERRKVPELHLAVIDYLQNLDPVNPRKETRSQVADTLRAARNLAMRFNGGEGVFIMSPHPTKQDAWREATKKLYYDLDALRETAESSAKPTAVLWVLSPRPMRAMRRAKVGIIAQRKGDTGPEKGWTVTSMLDRTYMADLDREPSEAENASMKEEID